MGSILNSYRLAVQKLPENLVFCRFLPKVSSILKAVLAAYNQHAHSWAVLLQQSDLIAYESAGFVVNFHVPSDSLEIRFPLLIPVLMHCVNTCLY